ncbi:hypothetical protein WISP_19601 [Willisornis vidua]|uniref:Uncharacterized protein n=1 Tax=Willisornis vidua TaxID=1566151 RepID=A0ABQ9DT78_9PASS|nr:hypothetical protein WISP_19601 [Willisornis vidua]
MKDHRGADIHLQLTEETKTRVGECSGEAVNPWEVHPGAGPGRDLLTCGEISPHYSSFPDRTCDPGGGQVTLEQPALEGLRPMEKGPMLEQFMFQQFTSHQRSSWRTVTHEKDLKLEQENSSP